LKFDWIRYVNDWPAGPLADATTVIDPGQRTFCASGDVREAVSVVIPGIPEPTTGFPGTMMGGPPATAGIAVVRDAPMSVAVNATRIAI
jgi:hypothetical protein